MPRRARSRFSRQSVARTSCLLLASLGLALAASHADGPECQAATVRASAAAAGSASAASEARTAGRMMETSLGMGTP